MIDARLTNVSIEGEFAFKYTDDTVATKSVYIILDENP